MRSSPVGGGMGQVAGLGVLARVCAHAPSTPAIAQPFLTPPAAAGQTSPMRPRRSRASLGLGDARAHCPKCLPILNPDPHGTWILPRAQVQARCDVPHCHRPRAARRPSGQGREGQKNDEQQPRQWPGPLSWPCSGTEHPHIQPVPTTQPSHDGAPTRSCAQKVRAFAGLWRVVGVSEALWEPWGLHSQLYTLGISSQNSVGVVFLFHQAPAYVRAPVPVGCTGQ